MFKGLPHNMKGFWKAYELQLQRRPIATQAATSAAMW